MTNYDNVARDDEPNVELAKELLARCQPLVEGSAQWRYLTETRGIPADAVRYCSADLRAIEPSIPGFDRLARGIVSLLRDQDGEITGLAVEACGIAGEALKGSDGRTARKTYALKKRGQIDALFRVDPVGAGAMICYASEGRLAKPLAVAALIADPAIIGWGGLHGLGRCLPPEPTVVVVEDAPPADPTKASLHDLAMARGCDRLIAGGRLVLRAGGPPCGCCKDLDEALGKHPADDLRAWITPAEPAELSLDGEARRCAKIRSPLRQAEEIAKVIAKHGLRKKGTTKGFRAQVAQYAGGRHRRRRGRRPGRQRSRDGVRGSAAVAGPGRRQGAPRRHVRRAAPARALQRRRHHARGPVGRARRAALAGQRRDPAPLRRDGRQGGQRQNALRHCLRQHDGPGRAHDQPEASEHLPGDRGASMRLHTRRVRCLVSAQ